MMSVQCSLASDLYPTQALSVLLILPLLKQEGAFGLFYLFLSHKIQLAYTVYPAFSNVFSFYGC